MRTLRETDEMFNGGEVCGAHGDENLQECTVCGAEFCRLCSPGTGVCPDCAGAEQETDPSDEESDGALDPGLERLLAEPGEFPDPDGADR